MVTGYHCMDSVQSTLIASLKRVARLDELRCIPPTNITGTTNPAGEPIDAEAEETDGSVETLEAVNRPFV